MVSQVEGLGTGTEAVTLVSFQGQAAVLMKDCVCPGGGAQDTASGLSAMRTLTLELWPLEGLSMVAPLMTVCQAGAVGGAVQSWSAPRPAAHPVGPPMHRI